MPSQRDGRMLVGLITCAIEMRDAHDHHLAQIARQRALLPDRGEVGQPALGDGRAVQQHAVEMQQRAALGDDTLGDALALGRVGFSVGKAGHAFAP
jgi:hypothetical protein